MKKVITILILFGFLAPLFSFAQQETMKLPANMEEAKEMGQGFLSIMPGFLKSSYQQAYDVGKWFYLKAVPLWNKYVFPWLDKYVLQKVEKRRPIIEKEFKAESKEMEKEIKTEVPRARENVKSIWQRLKELTE